MDAIAFGGIISIIGFLSQAPQNEMLNVAILAFGKGAVVRGIMISSKQQLQEAVTFIGARNLDIPVKKTFEFSCDQVVEAFSYMASGQHIDKICIVF